MSSPSPSFPFSGDPTGPLSFGAPSATQGAGGSSASNQGPSDSSPNASLYLYTFLATLVLLLTVSSAIVIRSLILRRRHQRLVEEAIRTGTWPPNRFDSTVGRRRRDIGQKPKLWETYLHPTADDAESAGDEKSKWGDITPFYATYVNTPASSPQGAPTDSVENSADPSSRPPRFIRPFVRRPSPQLTTASPMVGQALTTPTSSPAATPTPAVRVAVLIAMPSTSPKHNGDESGPPVVEIGVAEADIRDNVIETSPQDGS